MTSNEIHFVSLANNFTVQFSNLLKLPSGMEKQNSLTGPIITGSFEKQAPGAPKTTDASVQMFQSFKQQLFFTLSSDLTKG